MLLITLYEKSMDETVESQRDYKIALVYQFLILLAPYWLIYSTFLNILNLAGTYEGENIRNAGCLRQTARFVFLSFAGPLLILTSQSIQLLGAMLTVVSVVTLSSKNVS